jgi:phytoene dehydrogenase-like protein
MRKRIVVIGAGYGGLAAAARRASQGREVTVLEKNEGRAAGAGAGGPGGISSTWVPRGT